MAAHIAYELEDGEVHGTLFKGMKFWVAQRVPIRNDILKMIKDNGGEVVRLEKQADILIADHARKDAPEGSVSWKFVTESIQQGQRLNKDSYIIQHGASTLASASDAQPSRVRGKTAPRKHARNPFTKDDDRILAAWVLNHALQDRISGNEVYKKLDQEYPNSGHTWQSWRDRWVKRLAYYSKKEIQALAREAPEGWRKQVQRAQGRGAPTRVTPIREQQATASQTTASQQDVSESSSSEAEGPSPHATPPRERQDNQMRSTSSPGLASPKRNHFTAQEDEMLVAYVKECENEGLHIYGNKIYQTFAEKHPQHTWQAWRTRWYKHLSGHQPGTRRVKGKEPVTQDSDEEGEEVEGQAEAEREEPRSSAVSRESSSEKAKGKQPARKDSEKKEGEVDRKVEPEENHKPSSVSHQPGANKGKGKRIVSQDSGSEDNAVPGEGESEHEDFESAHEARERRFAELERKKQELLARKQVREHERQLQQHQLGEEAGADEEAVLHYTQEEAADSSEEEYSAREQSQQEGETQDGYEGPSPDLGEKGEDHDAGETSALELPRAEDEVEDAEVRASTREPSPSEDERETQDDESLPIEETLLQPASAQSRQSSQAASSCSQPRPTSRPIQEAPPNLNIDRKVFWYAFNQFRNIAFGPSARRSFWAQIGRHTVDYYNLWVAVTKEDHHASRNWWKICEDLGLNWIEDRDLPDKVKEVYERELMQLEAAIKEYSVEELRMEAEEEELGQRMGGSESDEEDEEYEQDTEGIEPDSEADMSADEKEEVVIEGVESKSEEEEDVWEEAEEEPTPTRARHLRTLHIAPSPPAPSTKRTFSKMGGSSSLSARKRRRYDRDEEIPETQFRPNDRPSSPEIQETPPHKTAASSYRQGSKNTQKGSQLFSRTNVDSKSADASQYFSAPTQENGSECAEPGTQYYSFPRNENGLVQDGDNLLQDDDDDWLAPSRQLLSELGEHAPDGSPDRPLLSIEAVDPQFEPEEKQPDEDEDDEDDEEDEDEEAFETLPRYSSTTQRKQTAAAGLVTHRAPVEPRYNPQYSRLDEGKGKESAFASFSPSPPLPREEDEEDDEVDDDDYEDAFEALPKQHPAFQHKQVATNRLSTHRAQPLPARLDKGQSKQTVLSSSPPTFPLSHSSYPHQNPFTPIPNRFPLSSALPQNHGTIPRRPSYPPPPDSPSSNAAANLEAFESIIKYYTSLGHRPSDISRALRATSLRHVPHFPSVLSHLEQYGRVEMEIPEVWTEREDEILRGVMKYLQKLKGKMPRWEDGAAWCGGDAELCRGFWRVVERWKWKGVRERVRFLEDWEMAKV